MDKVELRTQRLVLSAPVLADVDAIFDACQDIWLAGVLRDDDRTAPTTWPMLP